ncbi:MAG: class I SAM-dependent methyltransferase [Bacteroidetes bacterium]|nr:class I SAM-dependent methyltransferase [Bacteroidota bacterium]
MDAAFDHIATEYDLDFTNTVIGKAQRSQVWHHLPKVNDQTNCLELNCGTGADALVFAQKGVTILATDVSSEMVNETNKKLHAFENASAKELDINKLDSKILADKNLVFSNFGGLNCISPSDWKEFANKLERLQPKSKLVFVIMGRKCLWEQLYFAVSQKKWSRKGAELIAAQVGNALIKTWYYSPREIISFIPNSFSLVKCKPVGFAVPPSYLEPRFKKMKGLVGLFNWLDKTLFSHTLFANYADHFYIEFEKTTHG